MNIPPLDAFINIKHTLPAVGTWRESVHVFDERSAQAIRAALAAGRPLLVRGDPGTGKSQLARAAAKVLGRKFLSQVVDGHTEVQDLWFRFDAVSRLGNAQVLSVTGKGKDVDAELNPQHYLSPGILWWAFAWTSAEQHACKHPMFEPDRRDPGDPNEGVVLLLDEIDKAEADLPNSLLETLDNGSFTVPWLERTVGIGDGDMPRPLVIITTNEDRQLPAAFVRRCLVLDLSLPESEAGLIRFLKERAVFHFPERDLSEQQRPNLQRDAQTGQLKDKSRFHGDVLEQVARQLYQDRKNAQTLGVTRPGQAEFIDILRVLDELAPDDTERQTALLDTIQDFALKKYPGMQLNRPDDADDDGEDGE
ncbi:MAG: AAA family ATPase [Gammaproteobacteria bacterium]